MSDLLIQSYIFVPAFARQKMSAIQCKLYATYMYVSLNTFALKNLIFP